MADKPVVKPTAAKAPVPVSVPQAAKLVVPNTSKLEVLTPMPTPAPVAPKIPFVAEPVAAASKIEVPPVNTELPNPAPLITEGKAEVTETFTKIEDTAQNFTTDATAKMKSAFEKGQKGVGELVEFSKGNFEAVVASGKVAAKGAEEIAKYATDYGRTSIEKANATAKQFAAVKSPTEFFQLQSEFAKSSLDAFVGEASKFGENYMKLLGEIAQPIQNRYALAVDKVKTAVAA